MLRDAIAELLGITVQHGDEWTIKCLSPTHTDTTPSASMYVGDPIQRQRGDATTWRLPGFWVCFSCGARGRITNDEIINYEPSTARNLKIVDELMDESVVYRDLPETWLDLFDYPGGVHPYWLSRFSAQMCWLFRLGYDFDTNSGTYPLRRNNGGLIGVVRRDLSPTPKRKYLYPRGVDISHLLFNHDRVAKAIQSGDTRPVVLTEGATDAIAATEAGALSVAIYGSHISETQVGLLNRMHPSAVVTAFDTDDAGFEATVRVHEMIDLSMTLPRALWSEVEGKDLASLSLIRRIEVLRSSGAVTRSSYS